MNIQEDDLKSSLPEEVTDCKDEIKTSNLSQNDLNVEKVEEEKKSAVDNSIDPMEVPLNNQKCFKLYVVRYFRKKVKTTEVHINLTYSHIELSNYLFNKD